MQQKSIASQGGKAAHQKGVAHQWDRAEAIAAGRKGGLSSGTKKRNSEENKETLL